MVAAPNVRLPADEDEVEFSIRSQLGRATLPSPVPVWDVATELISGCNDRL